MLMKRQLSEENSSKLPAGYPAFLQNVNKCSEVMNTRYNEYAAKLLRHVNYMQEFLLDG
jgi:hypothetical protein